MSRRVVITGIGVISSIGTGKDTFWNSLLQGKTGISQVSSFDTTDHFTHMGGEIKDFMPEHYIKKDKISCTSRATQLGFAASKLALEDAGIHFEKQDRVSVCLGTTNGSTQSIELVNDLAIKQEEDRIDHDLMCRIPTNTTSSFISNTFGFNSQNLIFSTACAAGNYAIGYGFDLIKLNRSDIVLVGGVDPFVRFAFTGFNQFSAVASEKCQPFDKNRKGMMVAEGAGILIIESLEHAVHRGAEIYAEILGYGLSCDAYHMTTPMIDGIAKCMEKAIEDANITKDDIDYISAHGTGTQANDKTEVAAIKMFFGPRYKEIPVSSIKSMLGHTLGAASALEAITCTLAIMHDIVPPTINYETPDPACDIDCVPNVSRKHNISVALNNSYAFGGNNASVVLKKYIP